MPRRLAVESFTLISHQIRSSPKLDLRIIGNYAHGRGAGVDSDEGAWVLVEHSLIFGNHTNGCPIDGGAGAYTSGPSSTLIVLGSTVAYNRCAGRAGGNGSYSTGEGNTGVVITCILWENRVSTISPISELHYGEQDTIWVAYTNSLQSHPGPGNRSKDPRFRNPDQSDFVLASDSPLLGAGIPLSGYQVVNGPATPIGW